MSTLGERLLGTKIKAAREGRGLTQAELGSAVGTNQQTVDRIERGQTTRSKWMVPLLRHLGLTDHASSYETSLSAKAIAEDPIFGVRPDASLIPVFSVENVDEDDNVLSSAPVDYVERPFNMKHSTHGYAVVVPDNDMSPAYKLRDTVFINPVYSAVAGDDVLVARKVESGWSVKLVHLLEVEPGRIHVRQWAHPKPEWLETSLWRRRDIVVARILRR